MTGGGTSVAATAAFALLSVCLPATSGVDDGGEDDETAVEDIVMKLRAALGVADQWRALRARSGGGRLDNQGRAEVANVRRNLERTVLRVASNNILSITDCKSEKRATDINQEKFLVRINEGRTGGMEGFTEPPSLNDLQCKGAYPLVCNAESRYRTISGICNNQRNVLWGATASKLVRFLPPIYADGKDVPRGGERRASNATNGHDHYEPINPRQSCECASDPEAALPSARYVTSRFHHPSHRPSHHLTYMFTQIGQFIDHDIALTPENDKLKCCDKDAGHIECFPIRVDPHDPHHQGSVSCLNFARSIVFCKENYIVREQMNAVTAFLDLSTVYGSAINVTEVLRSKTKGDMRTTGGHFAPIRKRRFISGDVRADEIPGLLGMHTLFIREHNRIAAEFRKVHPEWDDEETFQRARRISIAQFQHIVYKDYLPILLGRPAYDEFKLEPKYRGHDADRYHEDVNPTIRNSFATAAYRFGHSMIESTFNQYEPGNFQTMMGRHRVRDNFFNSSTYIIREGKGMEETMCGQLMEPSQSCDPFFVSDITESLFQNLLKVPNDLPARNIQRGRDHGLPPYNDFRQFCGLPRACTWDQPPKEVDPEYWAKLSKLYLSPSDIDLFTGGLAETNHPEGVVGETFRCLIGKQFQNLKFGDRFFYTFQDNLGPMRFTPQQLDNLWKRSLGDVMCDCTNMSWMRKDVFRMDSGWLRCGQHNKLDMSLYFHEGGGSGHGPAVQQRPTAAARKSRGLREDEEEEEEEALETVMKSPVEPD